MKAKAAREDKWLKSQQKLRGSDVAEFFVSVTDVKHYVYCPRLIYFDRVLHATPIFGSQQEEGKESHEDYVAKELRRKDAIYYSSEFVGAEKLLFNPLSSDALNFGYFVHEVFSHSITKSAISWTVFG
jgi:CRISPR/Cas system-associated exonuclease Cas4 (RecB family)